MVQKLVAGALLALTLAVPAQAQPPALGATHTFLDPVFKGTVFCDTLEEVWAIATAEKPNDIYATYNLLTNDRDEPICMAIVPTGTVIDVTPIGVMERNGRTYNAWAVETNVGGTTAFALYLEKVDITQV